MEDYLETVLLLVRDHKVARVRDIANLLGVGPSSVTAALKSLSKKKLVNYDPYQVVTLTEQGTKLAEDIRKRHNVLRRFCTEILGLDADTAEANACRIEHAADNALLERLRSFVEFILACPRAGESLVDAFKQQCRGPKGVRPCQECLDDAMEALLQRMSEQ